MSPVIRTHYQILGIALGSTPREIKAAFREAALAHHPDRNESSPAAAARFRLIRNAYDVLVDPGRREAYDRYLRGCARFTTRQHDAGSATAPLHLQIPTAADSLSEVLAHLSAVLWDVEDLIRSGTDLGRLIGDVTVEEQLLAILQFVDRWVLVPGGFPDYFYEARRIDVPTGTSGFSRPGFARQDRSDHRPYVSTDDYFYTIRRRVDRFLERVTLIDLSQRVADTPVTLFDGILEAHNFGTHTIGHLRSRLAGITVESGDIPRFRHSRACFES